MMLWNDLVYPHKPSRWICFAMFIAAVTSSAQTPNGPGRAETEKLCSGCHELDRAVSLRQNRDGWKATINRMVNFGADGTEAEFAAVLDYLSANYPASDLPPLNVNTARAIDFESRLSLRRSQAAAIVEYRTKHGRIKSIEELKTVPGVDTAKIEAKKDVLTF
jgi:competence protein ComEA